MVYLSQIRSALNNNTVKKSGYAPLTRSGISEPDSEPSNLLCAGSLRQAWTDEGLRRLGECDPMGKDD